MLFYIRDLQKSLPATWLISKSLQDLEFRGSPIWSLGKLYSVFSKKTPTLPNDNITNGAHCHDTCYRLNTGISSPPHQFVCWSLILIVLAFGSRWLGHESRPPQTGLVLLWEKVPGNTLSLPALWVYKNTAIHEPGRRLWPNTELDLPGPWSWTCQPPGHSPSYSCSVTPVMVFSGLCFLSNSSFTASFAGFNCLPHPWKQCSSEFFCIFFHLYLFTWQSHIILRIIGICDHRKKETLCTME